MRRQHMVFRHPTVPWYPMMFGLLLAGWGFWLTMPGDSYESSKGFGYLSTLLPEPALGAIAIAIGVAEICGVYFRRPRVVLWSSMLSFYFWGFIAASFALAEWLEPGVILYIWLAVMTAFGYVNAKINQREDSQLD